MAQVRFTADVVVTCDTDNSVYAPGVVDAVDGRVAWVGSPDDAPEISDTVTVDNVGGLIMPGLINAHCHTPMTLVRGSGDGLPLHRWLTEAMWPREGRMTPADAWWGMTLGSAEMLLAGVTTSCEMYLFEDAVVDAARASGARLVMTPGVVAALHPSGSDRSGEIAEFFSRHHDPAGRVTVGVAPHSAYDLGVDAVGNLADLARSLNTVLHLHLAETREESAELEASFGCSVTRILYDQGVFEGRVLAAHCVWVDTTDINLLAANGVAVAHCPISNMKLGSGIAPLAAMRDAGVTVAYGTDGPASNDSLDLWEEVKMGALLARAHSLDSTLITAVETLSMATRYSAAAVGLDDTGCLIPGNALDMIRIDLDQSTFVPVTDIDELLAHLAWSGSSRKVTDVWVAGEKVVADGEVLTVDTERAVAEVRERALRLAGA
ncbi:MAG: amidohydrolase [Acidimicrobiales bacterium]|nr:amidohydrolase [Acidimicrobiales bacterium]